MRKKIGYGVLLAFATMAIGFSGTAAFAEVMAKLTTAPNVPADERGSGIMQKFFGKAETVVVNLQAEEYVGDLAEGVKYGFWSFGGTVPGPMARVRVGDSIEFHLSNAANNTQPHNIDIHAVNGPGGGAAFTTVEPGEEKIFTFQAKAPGIFIYHCAAGAIVDHISNGMYGLVLVEPEGGLPKVDREFYVMQSEFFASEPEDGIATFDIQKGLDEHPTHVVFNGKAGGLLGDNALKAKVDETVRIYFGNIGPNSVSSFHIIGEIFDEVYDGGIGGPTSKNIQTTLVPSAGATIVDFKVDAPGTYILVDHSIYRVAKGAIGHLVVEGNENPQVIRQGK